jgi:curved DNA-binding protein CbpA
VTDKLSAAEFHRNMLGLRSPFELNGLRSAYYGQIKQWHPDRFFGNPEKYTAATEKAKQLNLAFEFLSEFLTDAGGIYDYQPQVVSTKENYSSREYRPKRTYEGKPYTVGFPDSSVTEIFVKSSHIISAGYDRTERILFLKFKGNDVYRYFDFPESLFEKFLAAESQGKFAHRFIYKAFSYERYH